MGGGGISSRRPVLIPVDMVVSRRASDRHCYIWTKYVDPLAKTHSRFLTGYHDYVHDGNLLGQIGRLWLMICSTMANSNKIRRVVNELYIAHNRTVHAWWFVRYGLKTQHLPLLKVYAFVRMRPTIMNLQALACKFSWMGELSWSLILFLALCPHDAIDKATYIRIIYTH